MSPWSTTRRRFAPRSAVVAPGDYEVAAFGCGEAFLHQPRNADPDCAIVDIHLDGLSGFDVKARLAALHGDVPVVFITASDDAALERSVADAGGVGLLRKPFSNDALVEAVGMAMMGKPQDSP